METDKRKYIALSHATTSLFEKPDLSFSRNKTDFGKGFYATMNLEQAVEWGIKKTGGKAPFFVNRYSFYFDDLSIKSFLFADREWLETVYMCRNGKSLPYDVVFGPVADDKVYETVSDYFTERQLVQNPQELEELTKKTLEKLNINKSYDQYAMLTEKALDNLTFAQHMLFSPEGELLAMSEAYTAWKTIPEIANRYFKNELKETDLKTGRSF